ncbi:MAG: transposase [Candidatus Acidiferrum sp.]
MPGHLKRYVGHRDLHFINFTCYHQRKLLGNASARDVAVKLLGETRKQFGFELLGYVIMPEHVHLLISESSGAAPARVIQVFKQRSSHQMRGSFAEDAGALWRFWQPRYYDLNVFTEKKLREKLDCMHMNPVRENLVSDPRDWPWSSWTFYERGEGLLVMDSWERIGEENELTVVP